MKIVSWQHQMGLFILDSGGAILVSSFPEGRVGMEVDCTDGVYRQKLSAEACEV